MGYRHKLGILDKQKHEEIKDMTIEQLHKWYSKDGKLEDYVPCYEITKEVYELGKYYDDEFLEKFKSNVFSKEEVEEYYSQDNAFYLINKEGFLTIIDRYRTKVLEYYQSLLLEEDIELVTKGLSPMHDHVKKKIATWGDDCTKYKVYPYNIGDREQITTSWDYEYSIFELVRIYKSVDWDKQLVTITAW